MCTPNPFRGCHLKRQETQIAAALTASVCKIQDIIYTYLTGYNLDVSTNKYCAYTIYINISLISQKNVYWETCGMLTYPCKGSVYMFVCVLRFYSYQCALIRIMSLSSSPPSPQPWPLPWPLPSPPLYHHLRHHHRHRCRHVYQAWHDISWCVVMVSCR